MTQSVACEIKVEMLGCLRAPTLLRSRTVLMTPVKTNITSRTETPCLFLPSYWWDLCTSMQAWQFGHHTAKKKHCQQRKTKINQNSMSPCKKAGRVSDEKLYQWHPRKLQPLTPQPVNHQTLVQHLRLNLGNAALTETFPDMSLLKPGQGPV